MSIEWVPSHVGEEGNDRGGTQGASDSLQTLRAVRSAQGIWEGFRAEQKGVGAEQWDGPTMDGDRQGEGRDADMSSGTRSDSEGGRQRR